MQIFNTKVHNDAMVFKNTSVELDIFGKFESEDFHFPDIIKRGQSSSLPSSDVMDNAYTNAVPYEPSESNFVTNDENEEICEDDAKKTQTQTKTMIMRPLKRNHVSFSTVHVRKHPLIMGDNPSCGSGPPTTLNWNFVEEEIYDVDDYEGMLRLRPREYNNLVQVYTCHQRINILREKGYSKMEIFAAQTNINESEWLRRVRMFLNMVLRR